VEVAGVEDSGQLTDGIIEDEDHDEGHSRGERLCGETRVGLMILGMSMARAKRERGRGSGFGGG
jgi:hypothetical protein